MIRALRALARLAPSREKKPGEVWHRVMVGPLSSGFQYRHRRTGELRQAAPGEVVEVDGETLVAVRGKVDIV
jgi:hypothetical protein